MSEPTECPRCNGKGKNEVWNGTRIVHFRCAYCNGSGKEK